MEYLPGLGSFLALMLVNIPYTARMGRGNYLDICLSGGY